MNIDANMLQQTANNISIKQNNIINMMSKRQESISKESEPHLESTIDMHN